MFLVCLCLEGWRANIDIIAAAGSGRGRGRCKRRWKLRRPSMTTHSREFVSSTEKERFLTT